MDGKKTQNLDPTLLADVPAVARGTETSTPLPDSDEPRRLSDGWALALALAPLLLFVAVGEYAPEPTETPTVIGYAIGLAMLTAMGATAGLALAHRVSAAIPAIGLGGYGVFAQIDCAMQSHAATGTVGFWVITAAFAGLATAGLGGAGSAFLRR